MNLIRMTVKTKEQAQRVGLELVTMGEWQRVLILGDSVRCECGETHGYIFVNNDGDFFYLGHCEACGLDVEQLKNEVNQ